jgi:hypothetical protein
MDIVEWLRKEATETAEAHKVALYGPGGGKPDAKPEDYRELEAAEAIVRLRNQNTMLRNVIVVIREWAMHGFVLPSTQELVHGSLAELCRKTEGPCFCGCHVSEIMD